MRSRPIAPTTHAMPPAVSRIQLPISSNVLMGWSFAEIAVAEELEHRYGADDIEQAIDNGEVEELRPPGKKADAAKQQHGHGADGIGCKRPVEHRRSQDCARQCEHQGDEQSERSGGEHYRLPSMRLTRRSISLSARPEAPSRVRAC